MTQYQRRYKAARALQIIPQSDCEVSDDNVSDIDDGDDYIASRDVDSEIIWRLCFWHYPEKSNNDDTHCTPWSNRIVAGKQEERRPRETEKEEGEDE